MTEPAKPAPDTDVTRIPASGKGLKIAFAVSLALNLLVAGLVAGAWMGEGHSRRGLPRDLSFGPFSEALSREDRRALRQEIMADMAALRDGREAARAEFDGLLAALRADPFDPVEVDAALTAIVARNAGRLEKGQALLQGRISDMSTEDRLAFADRLAKALARGPRD